MREDNVIHEVENALNSSTAIAEMEQRPVHLRMKEDEQKLSFNHGGRARSKQNYAGGMQGMGMKYNSSGNFQEYDDNRRNLPTQGQTAGMISPDGQLYDNMSHVRASQKSGIERSDALNSGMQLY